MRLLRGAVAPQKDGSMPTTTTMGIALLESSKQCCKAQVRALTRFEVPDNCRFFFRRGPASNPAWRFSARLEDWMDGSRTGGDVY